MSLLNEFTVSENHLKYCKFLNEFNMDYATLGYQTGLKNFNILKLQISLFNVFCYY
jgi:hypothetical protein